MRIFIYFFFILTITACQEVIQEENSIEKNSEEVSLDIPSAIVKSYDQNKLEQCIDSIWRTATIQNLQNEIELLSKGERTLSCLTVDSQYSELGTITLKFGEDNGLNFVTYHNFIVYAAENWAIYYYDVIEGEEITFEAWKNK